MSSLLWDNSLLAGDIYGGSVMVYVVQFPLWSTETLELEVILGEGCDLCILIFFMGVAV